MAVRPALTNTEKTNLAGINTVARYLSVVPDTVIATARINQASFNYPLITLTVDTTSGWSDIRTGMTVYIGSTSGARNRGAYRVKASTSTTLTIQELGKQDPGGNPLSLRTTGFSDNDYVTVIDRRDIWSVLPRIDSDGTVYEDYNDTVGTFTTTPPPIVNISINNTPGGFYATYITSATHAITAVVSVTHWPVTSGATYAWSGTGAWSSVSGTTSATLTGDAPPGNYTLRLTVTPTVGQVMVKEIQVNIHDATINPPIYISDMPTSDTRDRQARRMSFNLNNNALASLPDGAMVCYFEVATWNGTDVDTATRTFVGWVDRQGRFLEPGLRSATIDIVGVAAWLQKLENVSHVITAVASPSKWTECVPGLCTASFMVFYLLSKRAANVLKIFNFTPFSTAASGQRLPEWIMDKATIYDQIQALATERGNFGSSSAGELFFLRLPSVVEYSARSAVVVRDSLDSSIATEITLERQMMPRTRQVRGEGLSWDGSATLPTPYFSDAPKVPGQGGPEQKLPSQVVSGQSELNQLTGDYYAYLNNPYSGSVTILKNRDVYEPAELSFVLLSISADESADGIAWSGNVLPTTITKRHNADGTSDIILAFEAETSGLTGDFVPVPAGNTNVWDYPPFDSDPGGYDPYIPPTPPPDIIDPPTTTDSADSLLTLDENCAIGNTATAIKRTFDLGAGSPTIEDITMSPAPTDIKIVTHDMGDPDYKAIYALTNDGTNTTVWYSENGYADIIEWVQKNTVAGIYTGIETWVGLPGYVVAYSPSNNETDSVDYNMTVSDQGFTPLINSYGIYGTWSSVGWQAAHFGPPDFVDQEGLYLSKSFSSIYVYQIQLDIEISALLTGGATIAFVNTPSGGTQQTLPLAAGLHTYPFNINTTITSFDCGLTNTGGSSTDVLKEVRVYYQSASGDAYTAIFNDYGSTLQALNNIGVTPGTVGGFSVNRQAPVILAAADQQVRVAYTLGGAFADAFGGSMASSDPICILFLWYMLGSVSYPNTGSSPHYLFSSAALVGGEGLWTVDGVSSVAVTPSIAGNKGYGISAQCLSAWKGKHWVYLNKTSGTDYASTTRNAASSYSNTAINGAKSVRCKRLSKTGKEWVIAAGSNGAYLSTDYGITWSQRTGWGTLLYIEIYPKA